jgi:hypothetical protein
MALAEALQAHNTSSKSKDAISCSNAGYFKAPAKKLTGEIGTPSTPSVKWMPSCCLTPIWITAVTSQESR